MQDLPNAPKPAQGKHHLQNRHFGALFSQHGVRAYMLRLISPNRISCYRKWEDRLEAKEVTRPVMVTLRLSQASCQLLGGPQLLATPDGATTAQEKRDDAEGEPKDRRAGGGSGGTEDRGEGEKEGGSGSVGGAWQLSAQCPVSPPIPCLILPRAPNPGSHHWYARLQANPGAWSETEPRAYE